MPASSNQGPRLLALYDRALPQVYGYLRARVRDDTVAEDLTAETFLAAVHAVKEHKVPEPHDRVARHRRPQQARRPLAARSTRGTQPARSSIRTKRSPTISTRASTACARGEVLAELGAHHRAALTLRYLDGLSVPEVADQLGRTVHATEALLVRARHAFRIALRRRELR